jgi:Collagen triple helix repeat (20 copies)
VFGVLSLVGVGVGSSALVVGLLILTGAAGIHGIAGAPGTNGANGVDGNNGINGGSGHNGVNGTNGANGSSSSGSSSSTTWGTIALSFGLGGKSTGVTILGTTCPSEGHGAYACSITLQSEANQTLKVNGLQYAQSPALYYAGADPTLGSVIVANGGATTTFTLWFQAVQYSGSANVDVTLLLASATTNA